MGLRSLLDVRLQVGQAELLLARSRLQVAARQLAVGVVVHLHRDRPPRLRAAADVVELEPHKCLDKRRLAVCLPTDHDDGRRVDRRIELLRECMQLVVCLVKCLAAHKARGGRCHRCHGRRCGFGGRARSSLVRANGEGEGDDARRSSSHGCRRSISRPFTVVRHRVRRGRRHPPKSSFVGG